MSEVRSEAMSKARSEVRSEAMSKARSEATSRRLLVTVLVIFLCSSLPLTLSARRFSPLSSSPDDLHPSSPPVVRFVGPPPERHLEVLVGLYLLGLVLVHEHVREGRAPGDERVLLLGRRGSWRTRTTGGGGGRARTAFSKEGGPEDDWTAVPEVLGQRSLELLNGS